MPTGLSKFTLSPLASAGSQYPLRYSVGSSEGFYGLQEAVYHAETRLLSLAS